MKQVTTLLTILTALNLFACGGSPGASSAGSPGIVVANTPSPTPSGSPSPTPSSSPTPPPVTCKNFNDTWVASSPAGANSVQITLSNMTLGHNPNFVFNYQYIMASNPIREINCQYDGSLTSTDAVLTYVSQDIEYSDFHCPATSSQYGPGGQLISTTASGTLNFTNMVQSCNSLTLKYNNQTYNFQ